MSICFQDIISDANVTNYCRICGMGIEEKNQKFCCENCENRFELLENRKIKGGSLWSM